MAEPTVDVGVDLEAQTITIGMLSDLTGPFGPLVSAIVAGHEAYWANVNANGGINGLTVELETVDTTYDVPTHVQFYEELKEERGRLRPLHRLAAHRGHQRVTPERRDPGDPADLVFGLVRPCDQLQPDASRHPVLPRGHEPRRVHGGAVRRRCADNRHCLDPR